MNTKELAPLQLTYLQTKLHFTDIQKRNHDILKNRNLTKEEWEEQTAAWGYMQETLQNLLTWHREFLQPLIPDLDNKTADEMYTASKDFMIYALYIKSSWQAELVNLCLSYQL